MAKPTRSVSCCGSKGRLRVDLSLRPTYYPRLIEALSGCTSVHIRSHAIRLLIGVGFCLLENNLDQAGALGRQVPLSPSYASSATLRSLRIRLDVDRLEPPALRERCRRGSIAKQRVGMLRSMLVAGFAYWRSGLTVRPAALVQPDAAVVQPMLPQRDMSVLQGIDLLDLRNDFA